MGTSDNVRPIPYKDFHLNCSHSRCIVNHVATVKHVTRYGAAVYVSPYGDGSTICNISRGIESITSHKHPLDILCGVYTVIIRCDINECAERGGIRSTLTNNYNVT